MKTRRHFLRQSLAASSVALIGGQSAHGQQLRPEGDSIVFGLCTYMWAAEWDIPTILKNCNELDIKGVELRVDHAHKVNPDFSPKQRSEVKRQFTEAGVQLLGIGTNTQFDSPDKWKLDGNLSLAMQYIKLSHDIGGSGVKVKPNNLHVKDGVEKDKTLVQIGKCLVELGDYSLGFGQEIRLEVHGDVTDLADIAKIMEVANADNVRVCWNCNPADLAGPGIEKNFALVKEHLGHTIHIHEQNDGKYPYDKLAKLLVEADYDGWVLMEAASKVDDAVKALAEHRELWDKNVIAARTK